MSAPTTDIPAPTPAWIWHTREVNATAAALAQKWAVDPKAAARWLAMQPGMNIAAVIAWTRVMHETIANAADRNAPTAEEIRDVVLFGQRRGW
jgi:hypothetical protein